MLGRDVMRACQVRGHNVIGLAHADLDITDGAAVDEVVTGSRPDVLVNCAAWTDVDGAEDHEFEATRVNGEAAGVAAAAAASVGAKVVYPSTDYVFDGRKRSPYVESDLTAPLSAYGRSKRHGETSVEIANERHFVVRSSWLYGVGGRNFVETMLALAGADQPEVLVVSDQMGCPTYTGHLAIAIASLIEGDAFGIHHLAGGGSCSWYEFAQEIFDQSGVECRVMAATTDMLERKAPRPSYSVLGTERRDVEALPSWREGLAAYLAERESLEVRAP
jgi:dTDP-4-dehydrorhamnose reductase